MENKTNNSSGEIRVNKVNSNVKEQLETIAQNKGITLSSLLKTEMPNIIERNKEFTEKRNYDD